MAASIYESSERSEVVKYTRDGATAEIRDGAIEDSKGADFGGVPVGLGATKGGVGVMRESGVATKGCTELFSVPVSGTRAVTVAVTVAVAESGIVSGVEAGERVRVGVGGR